MSGNAKFLIHILIWFLLLPPLSYADNFVISGFFETGMRSQEEDFEEEQDDSEYTFQKYHINLLHNISDCFNYELGYFKFYKDYRSKDSLDNAYRLLQARGEYYLNRQKQEFLKLNITLRYKEKRYDDSPSGEYDQSAFSPELTYSRKDSYSINASAGVNNYDYISADGKDEFKIFSKLGVRKYFMEKHLTLVSSYRFETIARAKTERRKDKNDVLLGFDFKIHAPFLQKISARINAGQRDSKDEDERDEDFDYSYRQLSVRTEHKAGSRLDADIGYRYFKKDYMTADLDHSGFSMSNDWGYQIFTDKTQDLDFHISAEHKDVDYVFRTGSDYKKETLMIRGSYRKKQNWNMSVSLIGSLYDFENPDKDKNRYYVKLYLEKSFMKEALTGSLNLKYKYTDNRHANNNEEESVRAAFQYEF